MLDWVHIKSKSWKYLCEGLNLVSRYLRLELVRRPNQCTCKATAYYWCEISRTNSIHLTPTAIRTLADPFLHPHSTSKPNPAMPTTLHLRSTLFSNHSQTEFGTRHNVNNLVDINILHLCVAYICSGSCTATVGACFQRSWDSILPT